ncbi:MAG TPA: hypothetical protein VK140_15845 [Ktedonobacteraceae bacterium]|nr:hypothetical protein [Ktedonobacteraceae bacterium]
MNREDSKKYLQMLGQELQKKQLTCEILVADGVVILLDVRKPEEPDIDAYMAHLRGDNPAFERQKNISVYFKESGLAIREAAMNIANQEHLAASWLNDAIKAIFFTSPFHEEWIEYPGLRIYLSPPDYLFAMKVATASNPYEIDDITMLADKLHLTNAQDMLALITKYIPEQLVTSEMRIAIKQAFQHPNKNK